MSNLPAYGPFGDEREAERFLEIIADAFAMPLEQWRTYLDSVGRENFRVVRADGRLAGGLAVLPMGQFFGGRSVPSGGVAAVATAPEHRARGTATALLRGMLAEQRARGVPLSALYPATLPLYRRVGYERAGYLCELTVPLRTLDVRDRTLQLRGVEPEDVPRLRALYRTWAAGTNGNLDRSEVLYRRATEFRREPGRGFVVLRDGEIEGYTYLVTPPGDPHHAVLRVPDLVAVTPAALRRLLTLIADHRTTRESMTIFTGPADPLLLHLAEGHYTLTARGGFMLRIIDVRGAFEARGWPSGVQAELHLDVADETLPENAGRWMVRIADGSAAVTRGGRGSLRVDIRGLAALYTGYQSPHELALGGLLSANEADLAAAAAVTAGPAPWMRDTF